MVRTIKISNVPIEATNSDIEKFVELSSTQFSIDRFEPPVVTVLFEDDSDAEKALFLNGMEILGVSVTVEFYNEEDIDKDYHILSAQSIDLKFSDEIPPAIYEEKKPEVNLEKAQKKSKPTPDKFDEPAKQRLQNVSLPARRKLDEKDPFSIIMNVSVSGVVAFTTLVYLTLSSFWA
ncbi:unnamed protein product [Blepharisma stoltei]|uniref:RRM domain-containing protein n=1 Tax=Blepharisma stoltei TaxID=1481888 RepID=A0AAU9IGC5_9CILI|nr:unnamed protein product [Blepharisma stoltei]